MNPRQSLSIIGEYAVKGAPTEERVHVYEALAALAESIGDTAMAIEASGVAESLRIADAAQLRFTQILNPQSEESR